MEDFNPRVDEKNLQTINLSSSDDESGACGKCKIVECNFIALCSVYSVFLHFPMSVSLYYL